MKPIDLEQFIARKIAFTRATFGPGERRNGLVAHARKELVEIETAGRPTQRHMEWVDLINLGIHGLTHSLLAEGYQTSRAAEKAVELLLEKQTTLEMRTWPDWRTLPEDAAIEHDRSGEKAS